MIKKIFLNESQAELINGMTLLGNWFVQENAISESSSVCFPVHDAANTAMDKIKEKLERKDWYAIRFSTNGSNFGETKKIECNISVNINGLPEIIVILYVFNAENEEQLKNYASYFNFGGEFDEEQQYIKIVGYALNYRINYEFIKYYVEHELLHTYQENKSKKMLGGRKLYRLSQTIITNQEKHTRDEIKLAWLFYWLNKNEVNANAQQLYSQIIDNKDYHKCDTYKELQLIKKYLNELTSGNINLSNCKTFRNINKRETVQYLKNKYNYALNKFGKVISLIKNEKKINENKFKIIPERLIPIV